MAETAALLQEANAPTSRDAKPSRVGSVSDWQDE